MTYKGHIEDGQIVLDESVELPEGATVVVELIPARKSVPIHPEITRFTGIIPRDVDAVSEHRSAIQTKHS